MKLAIVLSHAEILTALSALVAKSQSDATIEKIDFSLNGEGEVTAVAHTADVDAESKPATRSRRGTASKDEAPTEEEAKPATTRSRRGTPKDEPEDTAEEVEDKPVATRSRRGASKPAEPTVPEKSEDEYDVNVDEDTADVVTYWVNNDDESEVFAVPAEQVLPDYELYTEVETKEEALALLAPAVAEPEPVKATRARRGASKEAEPEEAPVTTGRTRRGATAPVEEEAEEAKPVTRRRGATAPAPAGEAPATTGRRKIFNRG